jgi:hypothetical protein
VGEGEGVEGVCERFKKKTPQKSTLFQSDAMQRAVPGKQVLSRQQPTTTLNQNLYVGLGKTEVTLGTLYSVHTHFHLLMTTTYSPKTLTCLRSPASSRPMV